jgi:uracil phosphoribosyltransferase
MALADAETPWALRVAALSDRLAAHMSKRESLVSLADQVLRVARDHECTRLVGASEAGRRIVEAAGQRDTAMVLDRAGAKVLLVDGLLATGTNLIAAAQRVRTAGASGIVVVAALAEVSAVEAVRRELGAEVVALELAA